MSKNKVFTLEGVTAPLIDGKTRNVTIAGVVSTTDEDSTIYMPTYVLQVGVSFIAPADEGSVKDGLSAQIAAGKAVKEKTCLMHLASNTPVFNKHIVNAILQTKLDHIISSPDTFVKLSTPKNRS